MHRRIGGHDEAIRARLAVLSDHLTLSVPREAGDAASQLRWVLTADSLEPTTRAGVLILAATGSYPTERQLESLGGWLAAGATHEAERLLDVWIGKAPRRGLARVLVTSPRTLIDLTRTSRAVEITGIPRVARALAEAGASEDECLVIWEGGVVGEVELAAGGTVVFPEDAWRQGGRMKAAVLAVKRRYWSMIRTVSRWPGGMGLVAVLRALLAPLGRALFGGAGPTVAVLLGPGRYVSPEVNLPDSVTRLLAWKRVDPRLDVTVVLHDFLPIVTPQFYADDQSAEFVHFARLVAFSDTVVVAVPRLAEQVQGARDLFGARSPHRTIVVPYGISARSWGSEPAVKAPHPEFVMVGSMEPRKNHLLALQALGRLAEQGLPMTLHIVGSARPVHTETIRALDRARELGVQVVEYRKAGDAVIRGLMANCTASLYLSWAEGYGLPVLESLVLGLPVIASDTPSNREHLEYGGVLLVPPDRPDMLAELIRDLVADDAWQQQLRSEIRVSAIPDGYGEWTRAILGRGGVGVDEPEVGNAGSGG